MVSQDDFLFFKKILITSPRLTKIIPFLVNIILGLQAVHKSVQMASAHDFPSIAKI